MGTEKNSKKLKNHLKVFTPTKCGFSDISIWWYISKMSQRDLWFIHRMMELYLSCYFKSMAFILKKKNCHEGASCDSESSDA